MRCEQCGRIIPAGERVETTRDEQIGSPGMCGVRTKTSRVTICARCDATRGILVTGLCVALGLGLVFTALSLMLGF
jgi:hypothetical protein